jgi:hypothetical protein
MCGLCCAKPAQIGTRLRRNLASICISCADWQSQEASQSILWLSGPGHLAPARQIIWQPTKSYVERCNAFRLIAHRCLPFFVGGHLSQSSETIISYSGGGAKKLFAAGVRAQTSQICSEISKVCSLTADYVRFTPKTGHWNSGVECLLCAVVSSGRRNTLSQTQETEWTGDGSKICSRVQRDGQGGAVEPLAVRIRSSTE